MSHLSSSLLVGLDFHCVACNGHKKVSILLLDEK